MIATKFQWLQQYHSLDFQKHYMSASKPRGDNTNMRNFENAVKTFHFNPKSPAPPPSRDQHITIKSLILYRLTSIKRTRSGNNFHFIPSKGGLTFQLKFIPMFYSFNNYVYAYSSSKRISEHR